MSASDILIIAVNYGSDRETEAWLANLSLVAAQSRPSIQVMVVDNTVRDTSEPQFEVFRKAFPSVICLKSPGNLGYFGGAQHGWSVWLQRGNKNPDWVVVSNVDVSIDDREFFNRLASAAYPDHVGVVGPSICSRARQGDWNPKIRNRPSARRMHGYKKLYKNHVIFNGYEALSRVKFRLQRFVRWLRGGRGPAVAAGVEIIYAPHGAFMLFSRLYLERGGDFRHPAFLFCEEIFVAETARALQVKVVYDPSLRITSVDHVSTGTFRSRKMVGYMRDAAVAITDKYFSA